MELSSIIRDPQQMSDYSINELDIVILNLMSISLTPDVDKAIEVANSFKSKRQKNGYRNRKYNGSEMQTKIHTCANAIEVIRASAYRHRAIIDPQEFEEIMRLFDVLIKNFSSLADDIRNGNFSCDCDKEESVV